jgi:hypothetical protein
MRKAIATAAALVALGLSGAALAGGPAAQPVKAGSGDYKVVGQLADIRLEFIQRDYDQVVDALKPDLQPTVFNTLSGPMRYEVLKLYARSLYGLSNWDEAHEAFVDLTRSSHATPQDWLLRLDTAVKVGDQDDAQLAHDRLQEQVDEQEGATKGDIV